MSKTNVFQILVIATCLTACTSQPKVTELSPTSDPQIELNLLRDGLRSGESEDYSVLSPSHFSSAKKSLEKAVEARSTNSKQSYVLHQIAVGNAYLREAKRYADRARDILKDVMANRSAALAANSKQYFKKETEEAEDQLRKLTTRFERGDTSKFKPRQWEALAEIYNQIEVKSIKAGALREARNIIDEALSEGAKKLTPETLDLTEKIYKENEAIVSANPRNKESVRTASEDVLRAAHRLLKIVRTAKNSSAKDPETLAIQAEAAEMAVEQAKQEANKERRSVAAYKGELENVSAEKQRLALQAAIERKVNEARAAFDKREADVFKQGDQIVLRLKGLSFPNNGSAITTANIPLLTKLQSLIGRVGADEISISGHTDSVGSEPFNEKLSLARAEAVRSFLIINNKLDATKVVAQGMGESDPIASNKTAKGRALNRRVDVILTSAAAEGSEEKGSQQ